MYGVSIYDVVAFFVPVVIALLVDFPGFFLGFLGCFSFGFLGFVALQECGLLFGGHAIGSDDALDGCADEEGCDEDEDDFEDEHGVWGYFFLKKVLKNVSQ